MARTKAAAEPVTVYPANPDAYPHEYVPGVGIEGAELPAAEAQAWLDAGHVTTEAPPAAATPTAAPESEE